LPFDKIQTFQENLLNLSKTQTTTWEHYKVHRGDTLEFVAQKFNTSVNILQQVNHLHNHRLTHVKTLLIPYTTASTNSNSQLAMNSTNSDTLASEHSSATENNSANQYNSSSENNATSETNSANANNSAAEYSSDNVNNSASENSAAIVSADNAQAQAAAQAAIAQSNNTANSNSVTSNSVNNITATAVPSAKKITHTIKKGETLGSIAKHYNVSVNELLKWNKINPKHLKTGMRLIIKPSTHNETTTPSIQPKKQVNKKPIHKIKPKIAKTHAKPVKHPTTHTKPAVHKSVPRKPTTTVQNKNVPTNNKAIKPTTSQTGN
jgi:membrane-bound lytic murein transglycosylase D